MPTVPILYASHDGHTRKITDYMASALESRGLSTLQADLDHDSYSIEVLEQAPVIVLAAAIRYGKPLPIAEAFLKRHRTLIADKPLVLLSMNLTARKPGKTTPEGSIYLRKWIKRHDLKPAIAAAVAGKLDYQRYGPFDRFMIRLIMKITGGPTEPTACVEFTNWDQVDSIVKAIAELIFDQQPLEDLALPE